MQIVIDIPEKEFGIEIENKFQDFFKRLEVETKKHMISGTNLLCGAYELETIQMLMQALAKGTPLPKGHGKLFDENKIKEEAIKCEWSRLTYDMLDHMLSYMKPIIKADKENE